MQNAGATCTRRHFFAKVVVGASLLAGAATAGCAAVGTYSANLSGGRIKLDHNQLELKMGEGNAILVRASPLPDVLILLRHENGTFTALNARCTHLGCQVRPGGEFLTCPCHQSTFDRWGKVVRGPAQKPLSSYPVEVREEQIEIVIDHASS